MQKLDTTAAERLAPPGSHGAQPRLRKVAVHPGASRSAVSEHQSLHSDGREASRKSSAKQQGALLRRCHGRCDLAGAKQHTSGSLSSSLPGTSWCVRVLEMLLEVAGQVT